MTDYRHMAGFKMQGQILQKMLQAVEGQQIDPTIKLLDQNNQPHQYQTNKEFVMELLKSSICEMFQNLNRVQVEAFVIKLFNSVHEWSEFKDTLRDLLVSMKSYAGENDELYIEEKQVSEI
jgi:exportin-1